MALKMSTRRKPKTRRMHRALQLHRPHRGNESDRPRVKGGQAKTGLQHERKQKRERSDTDPEQRSSHHARAKGFDGKKLEVEQRKNGPTSVQAIGRQGKDTEARQIRMQTTESQRRLLRTGSSGAIPYKI